MTLAGVLSGPGGLRLLGGGRLVLAGSSANTYAGVTRSLHGELQLRKPHGVAAVPAELRVESTGGSSEFGIVSTLANEQIVDWAPVTIGERGTLAVGAIETIGPLTLHRPSSLLTRTWQSTSYTGQLIFGGNITVVGDVYGYSSGETNFHLPASRTITVPAVGHALFLRHVHGVAGAGLTLNGAADPSPTSSPGAELVGDWNGATTVTGGVVLVRNEQTALTLQGGRFWGTVAALTATGGVLDGLSDHSGTVSMSDIRLGGGSKVALEVTSNSLPRIRLNGTLELSSPQIEIPVSGYTVPRQFGATYTIIENAGQLGSRRGWTWGRELRGTRNRGSTDPRVSHHATAHRAQRSAADARHPRSGLHRSHAQPGSDDSESRAHQRAPPGVPLTVLRCGDAPGVAASPSLTRNCSRPRSVRRSTGAGRRAGGGRR